MTLAPILALLGALLSPGATPAQASPGVVPYYAPPFASACTVHQFAEGKVPDLRAYPEDPLCVEYAKRDITVDNGGALAFALAEPARFALAGTKCRYWQQDHWSVQLSRSLVPVIRWDGSYWFDLRTGQAGARLSGLTIGGRPATIAVAAAYVAPYSPQLATFFLQYGSGGDGGAVNLGIPLSPLCA